MMQRRVPLLSFCLSALGLAACSSVAAGTPAKEPGFIESTFAGLKLRSIGPALMSGRIADIALHPGNRNIRYVAAGSGGVWKTVNAGTTWKPIFEDQASYSIGCITLDPNHPNTVWVGTGENVSGRHVGYGDGVYRSQDGGATWTNMGLKASEHIGMIRIHPKDSNVVYVAAQGPLWSSGGDRGLFKSTDGGKTWTKLLGGGPHTGVSEVHLDPRDPDVLYAVTWQRQRNVAVLMDSGPESGIHKSTDGGKTWRELTKGLPSEDLSKKGKPGQDMGKIGLAISPLKPDVIYATIELARRTGGFWRSADGGETWEKRSDYIARGTGPHYYQEVYAHPHFFDRLYQADVFLHVSEDGGKTWTRTDVGNKHVDHHAMVFDPRDPAFLMVGTDGGLYESFDLGAHWRFTQNLPLTQFYKVAVDYDEPVYHIYGGTQDNGTQGGPSRTLNVHGIRNSDWQLVLGADGHQPAVDPTNPDIVYGESQVGGLSRVDRRTGEETFIQPQPRRGEPTERFNWDSPILISPHNPSRLYFASQRVWRSDDRGDAWTPISEDLTRNQNRLLEPIMGRKWSYDASWDLYAMSFFNTVTSLSESPKREGLIYAGTDDGLIQVTEDGGKNWRKAAKLPGAPKGIFVNDIKADLHDENTVYAVVDNHKAGDFKPYVYKSNDRGKSWRSIAGNLPDRHIVWRLVQDHVKPDLMFVGTEFGVFFSVDAGKRWTKLAGDAPNIPFRDLVIQKRENDLVGATFGRGFYILDDYTPLRHVTEESLRQKAQLFPVPKARWYVPRRPLGCDKEGCKGSQGHALHASKNPPFGAIFTYYLPEEIKTAKATRQASEDKLEKAGKDTPFPGWDAVLEEELEKPPAIILTVTDNAGKLVRKLEGPVEAGFHRVAWDLRYGDLSPWTPPDKRNPWWQPIGVLVAPGNFKVSMALRKNGAIKPLDQPRSFAVVSIRGTATTEKSQADRVAFLRRVQALDSRVSGWVASIDELVANFAATKDVLMRSTATSELYTKALAIEKQARRLRDRLATNKQREALGEPGPVSIGQRLNVAGSGNWASASGPTATQRDSFTIADDEFKGLEKQLERLFKVELVALKKEMEAAGVPWSPGR